ncbi:enoyl-CoA hydratase/isomerase family protein [Novosphingobium lubricantis]|uniref:enoyl-CoA hydratase/isomerase family protein n=1 Tax=Novosphingobium sp. CCH12-A3 TaxID=1768752 RepID=UPI0007817A4F|nr:enoyl-CoA hydratase/isomerase family protein [Novosphingobium sp. CCH12-A3]
MISIRWHERVACIVLERPETRNALTTADWRSLAESVEQISQADCTAAIVCSASPQAFCSGSDIKHLALLADDKKARPEFRQAMTAAIEGLAGLPMPVVAAIDGPCFGAGVALALACDVRISSPRSTFCVPPAKLGISYPATDIARLVEAIGRGQSSRLLLFAEPISATEARDVGLVEILNDSPLDEALRLCGNIANFSHQSIGALKVGIKSHKLGEDKDLAHLFDELFESEFFRLKTQKFREG